MKWSVIFLLFLVSVAHQIDGELNETDRKFIKTKKVINVCINPDWAPIEFREDKKPQGISIDILKYISNKVGLKLHFIYTTTWSQSQLFLKQGKCDITPTAIKTIKREKYAIFTRPYLTYDLAIITTQDKPYITQINAIINKTITRKKGSGLITKLKRIYPHIDIIEADNFVEMFELVSKKKVYATIATLPVFAYYKKKYNFYNLKVAGFTGWKYPLRIMVNKNEPLLRELLDSELRYITPQTTQRIYEKWIVKIKPEFDYKELFTIVFVLFILLLFFSIWLYSLNKKNQELKKLSQIKSQFLANMSHEIRTPLNAIVGFIQIIKKNPKDCEDYLPLIYSSSQILISIIDDILNFSRLEKKELKIYNKNFYSKVLEDIILFYEEQAKNKNLTFDVYRDTPMMLNGDIDKIRDIVVHLVDNAIKFTEKGGIKVYFNYKDEHLNIKIIDTGKGILQSKLDKIFQPFTQLDNRINKDYQGIGIGLSIVKKMVESLNGTLRVKSEIDKGSEFEISIPIKKVENKKKNRDKYEKILVVEDNKANQMFMQVILKQLGVEFEIANNGLEALNMYKAFKYPLILMDINMPVMDGITATKKIREFEKENNLPPTKIIAVTANAIDGDEEKFNKIMDGYLAKPVDIHKLKQIIV